MQENIVSEFVDSPTTHSSEVSDISEAVRAELKTPDSDTSVSDVNLLDAKEDYAPTVTVRGQEVSEDNVSISDNVPISWLM